MTRGGKSQPGDFRILLVDDVRLFLELEKTFLRRLECDTLTASSGEEALDVVRARRPHLVVLDDQMPGIGGLETCRRIKSDPELKDTLVMMASSPVMEPACREAGADEFLAKPIVRDGFLARVRALLPNVRLRANERSFVRFTVEVEPAGVSGASEATGQDGRQVSGESRDVSMTGLFVRCDQPLEPGIEVALRLRLPGRPEPLSIAGVVRNRVAPDGERRLSPGFGVEFSELSSAQRTALEEFLRGVEE